MTNQKNVASPPFQAAIQEVRAVYDALAQRPLERNCIQRAECCCFGITGKTPQLTKGEALLAALQFRASGRKEIPATNGRDCPFLARESMACTIYEGRPFGCRTHFCAPAGGPYPRSSVLDLIRRLEKVDSDLGGEGPRPIGPAVTSALADASRMRRTRF